MNVPFDVERFAERIKNSRFNNENQAIDGLARLSNFYKLEDHGLHEKPISVVDCEGRILLWYLPGVLSKERVVRITTLDCIS